MATEQYRLQNLSCANCAAKFEKNVASLPNVEDVKINFGAAKLTVTGSATIEELEEAGAFDNIKVVPATSRSIEVTTPFWKRRENKLAVVALLFVAIGYSMTSIAPQIAPWIFGAAILFGGIDIFKVGFQNLIKLQFDMKTLMTIAIIGAAIIGEWQEAAIVVFLFAVSEALEAYSMNKARQSIRQLMDIAPATALKKVAHGDHAHEVEVETEQLAVGDVIIIKPGSKIAMDGIVVSGQSTVNEASITGEAMPVLKQVGDAVFAGTLNEEGAMEVRVTKHVNDTTIAKIIHLVEEAQQEKAPSQKFVDRFAKIYTPIIMFIALLVAVVPPLFTGDWSHWIYQGLAVLVVGCPCALVISTPVAIVTAIGNAAKQGVLIKGGVYLEALAHVEAMAFDKTGTLTKGMPAVTNLYTHDEERLLQVAGAVETKSQHPLARAILHYAFVKELHIPSVEQFQSVTGKGAKGIVNGNEVYVGSLSSVCAMMDVQPEVIAQARVYEEEGKSLVAVVEGDILLGLIAVADEVREESAAILQQLKANGVKETIMLTGDGERTANAMAKRLGVTNVRASLLPEQKLAEIKMLQDKFGQVAMVGDGVNDAPALAAANIGIAMGGAGTDTALETADIALMSDDLTKLPYTIRLSRKTLTIIQQNIAFALGLKMLAILLVVPGWLTLWIAIFADIGATLLVVLNSLRLMRVQK
ncbi:heavy metal translocating P-type ATPase [Caryophanon latum]|uniref:Cd(2+)-exporting ATPase n=1 Tax=Caryophanon latum TaxID=33977 RepID=A0A1C0Z4N5_9BACL|nr:heavy metal translocating P-type ATPase [Caryophanon latum]OCS94427.1 cadmium transporter [Caryophanon latum]